MGATKSVRARKATEFLRPEETASRYPPSLSEKTTLQPSSSKTQTNILSDNDKSESEADLVADENTPPLSTSTSTKEPQQPTNTQNSQKIPIIVRLSLAAPPNALPSPSPETDDEKPHLQKQQAQAKRKNQTQHKLEDRTNNNDPKPKTKKAPTSKKLQLSDISMPTTNHELHIRRILDEIYAVRDESGRQKCADFQHGLEQSNFGSNKDWEKCKRVVKSPIGLEDIRGKTESYQNFESFTKDFQKVIKNARLVNKEVVNCLHYVDWLETYFIDLVTK